MTRPRLRSASLLPVALALLLAAAPTLAQSTAVMAGWGESPANGAPTEQPSDCLSNSGSHSLVFSIVPPADLPGVRGFKLDLVVAAGYPGVCDCFCPGSCVVPNLPAYWDLSPTGCRPNSITSSAGFPGDAGTSAVENPFLGGMVLVTHPYGIETRFAGVYTDPVPYTCGRYVVEFTLPPGTSVDLVAGREYYLATVSVRNAKTTSCAGCCNSVGFSPAIALDLGLGSSLYLTGAPAFWQGTQQNLCAAVPTHSSTWGALKSVYR